ncbi:MAG: hypothetical protein AAF566_08335 [Pseudomonadota bacterium]
MTLYATGVRNAYDLIWHSNGGLYTANNGSARGGNSPDNPATAIDETITGGDDPERLHLYRVTEGQYYGHPNPARAEFVRDGGNPTPADDVDETSDYPVGVLPDPGYGGFVFGFGQKRSPNGTDEYDADAFGGALKGDLLVAEFSQTDRIVGIELDASGEVVGDYVLATGLNNPLDLAVHQATGRIYVTEFGSQTNFSDDTIVLFDPLEIA